MTGSSSALPAAVRGWSAALAALQPSVVHALAPLLERVDELVGRHVDVEGPDGEPEGYGGLTTRGTFERLLASEWALADVAPDEFLRRAAARELLHVERAFRHTPTARVTRVVVDTGPAQAGAARLVQLAALVVLHRRAAAHGARVEVGVLGGRADRWVGGDLPELLAAWLASRATADAGPERVAERHAADPDAWFVVRPGLLDRLAPADRPVRRVLTVQEAAWSDAGVVGVDVVLAGERVHLPVPSAPEALRVLRGNGFRRTGAGPEGRPARRPGTGSAAALADGEPVLHDAVLTGAGEVIVGRGREASELVVARVVAEEEKRRPRVRRLRGPALAVGATGRRLIVLTAAPGGAVVDVVGKQLRGWGGAFVDAAALASGEEDLTPGARLAPVHHDQGSLWVGWPSGWRRLAHGAVDVPAVAVLPRSGDTVVVAVPGADRTSFVHPGRLVVPAGARVVGGGAGWAGIEAGDGTWWLAHARHERREVTVAADAEVVGLVVLSDVPHLVTVTEGVPELVGPLAGDLLRGMSGVPCRVAVHPVHPWLARDVGEGEIELHDLDRDVRIATYPGNLA